MGQNPWGIKVETLLGFWDNYLRYPTCPTFGFCPPIRQDAKKLGKHMTSLQDKPKYASVAFECLSRNISQHQSSPISKKAPFWDNSSIKSTDSVFATPVLKATSPLVQAPGTARMSWFSFACPLAPSLNDKA